MPNVTVCLPWRATPDRIPAHDRCVQFWRDNGFDVVEADSDPSQAFLCNQARNAAVRAADTPLVIVADADTLPASIGQVHRAIWLCRHRRADFVWPFRVYRYISADYVDKPDLSTAPVKLESLDSPGGVIVARTSTFWEIGGYPEGFVPGGSGFDDTSFLFVAQTLARTQRVDGVVFSFDHAVERNYTETNPNFTRYQQFKEAYEDPAAMRRLIHT